MKVDKLAASASKEHYSLKSVFPVRQNIIHADLMDEPHSSLTGFSSYLGCESEKEKEHSDWVQFHGGRFSQMK